MANAVDKGLANATEVTRTASEQLGSSQGIFAKLAQEHSEAAVLIGRLSRGSDSDLRRGLFPELRDKLLAHEEAELLELYTALRRNERTRAISEAHDTGAGRLHVCIDVVGALEPDDPDWASAFEQLVAAFEEHVATEEGEYFPKASQVLSVEEAQRLEQAHTRTRQRVLNRLQEPDA
jgi:hypothetical protein